MDVNSALYGQFLSILNEELAPALGCTEPIAIAYAAAAAGSDARMNGCTMPVVINSGSGNQGITVSVPVILYGLSKGLPKETIYRALALSNLTAIYQKAGIGRLSAYCGAVSAAVGAAAGITWPPSSAISPCGWPSSSPSCCSISSGTSSSRRLPPSS